MIVYDLDGNEYNWQLVGHKVKTNRVKSSLHTRARALLASLYPTLQILEEVPINVHRGETLYLDFYLPLKKLCVETHGEQHYKFIAHYHNNALGFIRHKKRDREKQEWCAINGIGLVELPFDESDDIWLNKLKPLENN